MRAAGLSRPGDDASENASELLNWLVFSYSIQSEAAHVCDKLFCAQKKCCQQNFGKQGEIPADIGSARSD